MSYKDECLNAIKVLKESSWKTECGTRAFEKLRKPKMKFGTKKEYMKRIEFVFIDIIKLRAMIVGYDKAMKEKTTQFIVKEKSE